MRKGLTTAKQPLSGDLQLLGRLDHQIKLGGVRLHLETVEACLLEHPRVKQAAARTWERPSGNSSTESAVLVAYVVLHNIRDAAETAPGLDDSRETGVPFTVAPDEAAEAVLRAWVVKRLPAAAVPLGFVALAQLPRTPAGKVLRSQLPAPTWLLQREEADSGSAGAQAAAKPGLQGTISASFFESLEVAPRTVQGIKSLRRSGVTESDVMNAFSRALGRSDLEPTDDFFSSGGGTSLAAAAVAAELGTEPAMLFAAPTARSLAALLLSGTASSGFVPIPSSRSHCENSTEEQPPGKRRKVVRELQRPLGINLQSPLGPPATLSGSKYDLRSGVASQLALPLTSESWAGQLRCSSCRVLSLTGAGRTATLLAGSRAIQESTSEANQERGKLPAFLPSASSPSSWLSPSSPPDEGVSVEAAWAHPLGRCIDASPLVVALICTEGNGASADRDEAESSPRRPAFGLKQHAVLACSHDGSVACLDGQSGQVLWQNRLPARAEAGMCLCPAASAAPPSSVGVSSGDTEGQRLIANLTGRIVAESSSGELLFDHDAAVAVSCGDGCVRFLSLADGRLLSTSGRLEGGLRAAPACDPWPGCGVVWVATHGRRLVALESPGGAQAARCGFNFT